MPNPIDAVIRPVEPHEKPSEPGDVHVIVNAGGTGVPSVVRGGFFTGMRRSLQHYIVNTQKKVTRTGLTLSVESLQGELSLRVGYEAKCIDQQHELLACGVARSSSPQQAVDQLIKGIIESFGLERLLDGYAESARLLKAEAKAAARDRLGLDLKLELEPGTGDLEPYPIAPVTLNVRTHDSALLLAVSFEAVLEVATGQHVKAHAMEGHLPELVERLIKEVEGYLRTGVSLQELYVGLTTTLPQGFVARTADLVGRYGRSLAGVILRCDFAAQHDAFKRIVPRKDGHYQFEYKNPRYPSAIQVDAAYNMHLVDLAKFITSGVTDLERWVSKRVQETSQDVLFKVSHEEFCSNFAASKALLEARMDLEAAAVGYKLDHFYALTNHQIDQFLQGAELGQVTAVCVLKSDQQVSATLKVVVSVKVDNLSKIIEKVKRNETVALDMQQLVEKTLITTLRNVTPEDFCKYFEMPRPRPGADGQTYVVGRAEDSLPSISELLEQDICLKLAEVYDAQVSNVHFVEIETELRAAWRELTGSVSTIEFTAEPAGVMPIQFWLEMRVLAVDKDSWHVFQRNPPRLDTVVHAIRSQLHSELSAYEAQALAMISEPLLAVVQATAQKRVLAQFGLLIQTITLRRANTKIDQARALENEAAQLQKIGKQARDREHYMEQTGRIDAAEANQLEEVLISLSKYERQHSQLVLDGAHDEADLVLEQIKRAEAKRDQLIERATKDGNDVPLFHAQQLGDGSGPFARRPGAKQLPGAAPITPAVEKSERS